MQTPLIWPSEAIWQAVVPMLAGFTVEVLPEVDSTNSELMRRAREGRTEPVLLVAQRQTAGRGRLGRQWLTDADSGTPEPAALTFSLGLHLAPADWSGLSLAVGVALAQSLHPDIRLKWPNDLWWRDRKLAGILIETANWGSGAAGRFAVVGVGVNVLTPRDGHFSTSPVGLTELLPAVNAMQALEMVVAPLVRTLKNFESLGFGSFLSQFNALDALADVPVTLSDGLHGVAHGVDQTGALKVLTAQGLQLVSSSEVSVRLLQGASLWPIGEMA